MSEELAAEAPAEENGAIEEVSQELQSEIIEGGDAGTLEAAAELSEEATDVLKDAVEAAVDDGATEEEVVNMIKQFTIKVNGKEYVKEIDLNDHDAVLKELQMSAAGSQAMQRSSQMEKDYEAALKRLQNDPYAVLDELGVDTLDLSEQRLKREIERQQMSPEDLARMEMQKELEEARETLRTHQEEKEQADFQKLQQEQAELIENDIMSAIDESGLPGEPATIQRVADLMYWAEENGFGPVSAKDVIPTVKSEMERNFKDYAKNAFSNNTEALKALLGDDIVSKMRQERVENFKQVNNVNNLKKPSANLPKKEEDEKPRKKRSLSDFMRG